MTFTIISVQLMRIFCSIIKQCFYGLSGKWSEKPKFKVSNSFDVLFISTRNNFLHFLQFVIVRKFIRNKHDMTHYIWCYGHDNVKHNMIIHLHAEFCKWNKIIWTKRSFCDDGRHIVQMPPFSSFKKYLFCFINNSRKM